MAVVVMADEARAATTSAKVKNLAAIVKTVSLAQGRPRAMKSRVTTNLAKARKHANRVAPARRAQNAKMQQRQRLLSQNQHPQPTPQTKARKKPAQMALGGVIGAGVDANAASGAKIR